MRGFAGLGMSFFQNKITRASQRRTTTPVKPRTAGHDENYVSFGRLDFRVGPLCIPSNFYTPRRVCSERDTMAHLQRGFFARSVDNQKSQCAHRNKKFCSHFRRPLKLKSVVYKNQHKDKAHSLSNKSKTNPTFLTNKCTLLSPP